MFLEKVIIKPISYLKTTRFVFLKIVLNVYFSWRKSILFIVVQLRLKNILRFLSVFKLLKIINAKKGSKPHLHFYFRYLEHELQEVISFDVYYEFANDLINSLLDKHREAAHYDKKRPFSCVYGVILSGCVQKQLAIPNVSCGYLVFLHHLKEKHLDYNNIDSLQKKQNDILKWIKQSVDKIRKEHCTDKIKILRHSKVALKIKWKGLEYHIVVAWTFSKRQYCEFHYIQNNVHVYPFSPDQLQTAANDLIDEEAIHERHIKSVDTISKPWKRFLERNMYASLSLLRVHQMRESTDRNTQLAILFLKAWQHIAMKDRQNLSNNALEFVCICLFHQLKKMRQQTNTPVFTLDIIRQFFEIMKQCSIVMTGTKNTILQINTGDRQDQHERKQGSFSTYNYNMKGRAANGNLNTVFIRYQNGGREKVRKKSPY
ncbi:hypothetical protein RFI_07914 [Reticulomyxa filosa]|uniref:Uncharacterized protein n=1 Tax=Reticulomyxa filosa TaxID=46433 RepID=X6NT74_RETFI|nr:hypothetical protein RFI_07914 [Reticulomyxa filosa]|eukprot:ETO29211.1 hypothetical protein RFI_07914 [Reticulomyxa filosa]